MVSPYRDTILRDTFLRRYVWVYLIWDTKRQEGELSLWTSPDANAPHLENISTPFAYQLTRNEVRYIVKSEVALAEKTAIKICGTMYDTEFEMPKTIARKRSRK